MFRSIWSDGTAHAIAGRVARDRARARHAAAVARTRRPAHAARAARAPCTRPYRGVRIAIYTGMYSFNTSIQDLINISYKDVAKTCKLLVFIKFVQES